MDFSLIVMWVGFMLAAYSVVGNDVIQTLGTFLTSNENERPWYVLFGFASVILTATLVYGYYMADIDYGRLDKFAPPATYAWYYMLPPLVLLLITRLGIPVSTTFMILTLFSLSNIPSNLSEMVSSVFDSHTTLGQMIQKSLFGYIIAFGAGLLVYVSVLRFSELYFKTSEVPKNQTNYWVAAQWFSTGFLWFQWLTQDLANIYIYLNAGQDIKLISFLISLLLINALLAYIFYKRGGKVQEVVRNKTNTADIRSATFIDLIYGLILYVFKDDYFGLWGGKIPMSTTWVFIGLLAGREIGLRLLLDKKISKNVFLSISLDLGKIFFGLIISVILVFIIKLLAA